MIDYKFRDVDSILKRNGYRYLRCAGSHYIYSDGINEKVVPIRLKAVVAAKIIKNLNVK